MVESRDRLDDFSDLDRRGGGVSESEWVDTLFFLFLLDFVEDLFLEELGSSAFLRSFRGGLVRGEERGRGREGLTWIV